MKEILQIYRVNGETGEPVLEKEFEGEPGQFDTKVFNRRSLLSFPVLHTGLLDTNRKKKHYLMLYVDKWNELHDEGLDNGEIRILNAVVGLITQFHTGVLTDEDGAVISSGDLIKRAKVDKSRGFKAINSLIERGVIAKERSGKSFVYFANPFLFACGKGCERSLVDKFHETKWAKDAVKQVVTYECKL